MDGPPTAHRRPRAHLGRGFGDTTERLAALVGPEGEARGLDVAGALHRAGPQGGRGGPAERRFRGRDVQIGDLGEGYDGRFADGVDVLRQPGAARARAARRAVPGGGLRGRLAAQGGQRFVHRAEPRRRRVRRASGGDRRADLRAGSVLDGERGHGQRATEDRRLRADHPAALRPCAEDRQRPRPRGRVRHVARPAGEVLRLWEDWVDEIRPKIAGELREGARRVRGPATASSPRLDLGSSARALPSSRAHPPRAPGSLRQWPTPHRPSPWHRAWLPSASSCPCSRTTFDPAALGSEVERLEAEMQRPGFWDDQESAADFAAHARAQRKLKTFGDLESEVADLGELAEMASEDEEMATELRTQLPRSSGAWRLKRLVCSAASTTPATRSSPSTRGRGLTPRTGPRSSSACTCAGPSAAASTSRRRRRSAGEEAGLKSATFLARATTPARPFAAERGVHSGPHPPVRSTPRPPSHQLRAGRRRAARRRGRRGRDRRRPICGSTRTGLRAPAASTSTRPTRRFASPTSRPGSSSSARTSARRPRTRPSRCSCCARS